MARGKGNTTDLIPEKPQLIIVECHVPCSETKGQLFSNWQTLPGAMPVDIAESVTNAGRH